MPRCTQCSTTISSREEARLHTRLCKKKSKFKQKINKNFAIDTETNYYKIYSHTMQRGRKRNFLVLNFNNVRIRRFQPSAQHEMTPAYIKVGPQTNAKAVRVLVHIMNDGELIVQPDELINTFQFEQIFRLPYNCKKKFKEKRYNKKDYAIKIYSSSVHETKI